MEKIMDLQVRYKSEGGFYEGKLTGGPTCFVMLKLLGWEKAFLYVSEASGKNERITEVVEAVFDRVFGDRFNVYLEFFEHDPETENVGIKLGVTWEKGVKSFSGYQKTLELSVSDVLSQGIPFFLDFVQADNFAEAV